MVGHSTRTHCSPARCTYSLGFFFGPGLPLSLGGALGSIIGAARLRPAMAPPLLRLPSTFGGGGSELGSGVSAPVAGTGVELESSDFEADDGSGCVIVGAESIVLKFGVDDDVFRDGGLGLDTIRFRASGATLRVTILVFREPFGVDLAGVAITVDEYVFAKADMGADSDGCRSDEAVTKATRGARVLGQPSGGYWGWVECRTLAGVLLGWLPGWSVVRLILRGGGWWYGVAGRGCWQGRSWAWAVKPGASHDGKLFLHCLLTRSGIIGLAGVGWLLCTPT